MVTEDETRPWVAGPALSIPPAVALSVLRARWRTDRPRRNRLAAELSFAAWGGFVFVFACPSDDPLCIAVWYTVGCSIVTIVGWAVLLRLPRW